MGDCPSHLCVKKKGVLNFMIESLIENRQDLNQVASMLLARQETGRLKKLAYDWLVPDGQVQDYIDGKRCLLVDLDVEDGEYSSVNEKLADELAVLADVNFADVIGIYVSKKSLDGAYARLVLQKHKSLQKCLDYILGKAHEKAKEQWEKSGTRQQKRMAFPVSDATVYQWVDEYFALDDEQEEMEKKEKAREDFIKARSDREKQEAAKTRNSGRKGKGGKTAAVQMNLFDLFEGGEEAV